MVKLKRSLFVVVILCVAVIVGWAAWYHIIVNPRLTKEPVKVYNTPQRTLDDSSEILPNSVPVDSDVDSQVQVSNSSKRRTPKNVPNSPEAISSTTNPKTHQHEHENEQGLSKEELAELREKNKEELLKFQELKEHLSNTDISKVSSVHSELSKITATLEANLPDLADRLNSLSAAEQKSYFDSIRSGKSIDYVIETIRNGFTDEQLASESMQRLLKDMRNKLSYTSDADRHLEELQKYGFKPKF